VKVRSVHGRVHKWKQKEKVSTTDVIIVVLVLVLVLVAFVTAVDAIDDCEQGKWKRRRTSKLEGVGRCWRTAGPSPDVGLCNN
jgi:hypothetical protein